MSKIETRDGFDDVMEAVLQRADGHLAGAMRRNRMLTVDSVRALGIAGVRRLKDIGPKSLAKLEQLFEEVTGEVLFVEQRKRHLQTLDDAELQRRLEREERALTRAAVAIESLRAEIDRRRLT